MQPIELKAEAEPTGLKYLCIRTIIDTLIIRDVF
jgi:hypothetical protein